MINTEVRASSEAFSFKQILPTLLAIALGMFLVVLDSTIMNVAIPKLVQYFDTDLKTMQWALTGLYTCNICGHSSSRLVLGSLFGQTGFLMEYRLVYSWFFTMLLCKDVRAINYFPYNSRIGRGNGCPDRHSHVVSNGAT